MVNKENSSDFFGVLSTTAYSCQTCPDEVQSKNCFGGYVASSVRANASLDGIQIQILD